MSEMKRPRWRSTFSVPQPVDAQTENSSILVDEPFNLNDGDFIGNCMRDARNISACSPEAELLREKFGETHHTDVRSPEMNQRKVALVDDCAFNGEEQQPRHHRGPLTAYELYELLREPRFRIEHSSGSMTDAAMGTAPPMDSTTTLNPIKHYEAEPNADRRLIYLTDLDKWSIIALLSTASIYQIGPLRRVLYGHIAPEAYIGIASCPYKMFELAFHLPFRAWRPQDGREKGPGMADVSFLDWDGKCPGYLCSAVYSCSIAGSDEWHWVAYCVVDTQFQGSSEDRESAEYCFDNMNGPGSLPLDPCGNMSFMNDRIGPNPRYWFLLVLEARLAMVISEWRKVARQIERSIERYRQVCLLYPSN